MTRAADDFAFIRARIEELRQARASIEDPQPGDSSEAAAEGVVPNRKYRLPPSIHRSLRRRMLQR